MDNEEQATAAEDVRASLSVTQPAPLDPKSSAPTLPKSTDDMEVDAQDTDGDNKKTAETGANEKQKDGEDDEDADSEDDGPVTGGRKPKKAADLDLFSDEEEDEARPAPNTTRTTSRSNRTLMDEDEEDDADGGEEDIDRDGPAAELGGGAAELSRRKQQAERTRNESALDDLIPDDPEDDEADADDDMFGTKGDDDDIDLDDDDRRAREELEYRETDEPFEEELPREVRLARIVLPNEPVRRTKEHWLARLPNFLDYRVEPFDEQTFDPETDDNAGIGELSVKERLADPELRMLMKTKNTIRWRWSDRVDEDGVKIPESNARILRWSDGTMSLQLGDEFFDVPMSREMAGGTADVGPAQANNITPQASQGLTNGATQTQSSQADPASSSASGSQPMSYIVVPHREAHVLQAEMPLAGSMIFRPYNLQSETHRKLAKAVKYHKVLRVQATSDLPSVDPEAEKLTREKQTRDEERKRMRKAAKTRKSLAGEEADDIDAQLKSQYSWTGEERRVRSRRAGAAGAAGDGGGGAGSGAGGRARAGRGYARGRDVEEDYEEDDFIVADETDEEGSGDEDGEGEEDEDAEEDGEGEGTPRKKKDKRRKSDAMEVDDEPDEMELAERRIEENEKAEKLARQELATHQSPRSGKGELGKSKVLADSDEEEEKAASASGKAADIKPSVNSAAVSAGGADADAKRKKRVILDDEDEE
ncbi:hypothetical protein V8E36_003746 [Tilletia maclaganii]